MQRINISSDSPFEKEIGFSRVVRVGHIFSISGTAPIDTNGDTKFLDDVYSQTKYCINIMKTAIEKAGGKIDDVIRTRIMLKDITKWEKAAKAHSEYFHDIKPACTFFEVKNFVNPNWLLENEADCVLLNTTEL